MGARYLVTGVQLGMIISLAKYNEVDKIEETVNEILQKQHVGNSTNENSEDVLVMKEGKLPLFAST
jgi:mannose/fructose-specific phosphotransferase system component IIA